MPVLPQQFTLYKITHVSTGQFYIGSTTNFHRRRYHHFNLLRRGNHSNRRLQAVWDTTPSAGAFTVKVMRRCSSDAELHQRERTALSRTVRRDPLCLNIYLTDAGGNRGRTTSESGCNKRAVSMVGKNTNRIRPIVSKLRSPDGTVHETVNLSRFAKVHGLRQPDLTRLVFRDVRQHKGWTLAA